MINLNFEEMLKKLRTDKGWSYYDLAEKINEPSVTGKNIKKWESGLEYPEINTVYKLSELYNVPSEDLLMARQLSLQGGLESIHMKFIKRLSSWMGISIKATIIFARIVFVLAFAFAMLMFYSAQLRFS